MGRDDKHCKDGMEGRDGRDSDCDNDCECVEKHFLFNMPDGEVGPMHEYTNDDLTLSASDLLIRIWN